MAYGGGTWTAQDKVLPGTFINTVSLKKANSALSERGIAAAPFLLNWGPEGTVFEVSSEDFHKKSKTIFGYAYNAPELLCVREIFCNAVKVFCYRLGTGGVKAENTYGTAKYPGIKGNDIGIVISKNVDNENVFDVSTYVDGIVFETQTVSASNELVDNDFVDFKKDVELKETAGEKMTGGTNAESITRESHNDFLNKIDSDSFNSLCCPSADENVVALYSAYTKRMRDELGAKFQTVAYKASADYEGVIGVWNDSAHESLAEDNKYSLVYWVAGKEAGVAVNETLTNQVYDGELTVDVNFTQSELKAALKSGKFMFHNANGNVRVVEDINTLITFTEEKGEDFSSNQTIRVCDQIANDTAVLFNTRYAGNVPNDDEGRGALWNDIVKQMQEYEKIRAIEKFESDTIKVEKGEGKKKVFLVINGINVTNMMSQLYMTLVIQ